MKSALEDDDFMSYFYTQKSLGGNTESSSAFHHVAFAGVQQSVPPSNRPQTAPFT